MSGLWVAEGRWILTSLLPAGPSPQAAAADASGLRKGPGWGRMRLPKYPTRLQVAAEAGPPEGHVMLAQDHAQDTVRPLETAEDLVEARLEAVGFIFHGSLPRPDGKRAPARAGSNLLHFARCPKLEKAPDGETKFWFRSIGRAKQHLDTAVGDGHWKWCKTCVKDVTQKILNEA